MSAGKRGLLAAPARVAYGLAMLADFVERGLPMAILAVALVSVPVMILRPEGLARRRALEQELAGVQKENAQAKREIGELRVEVKRLREDPRAVERIARDQLGLVRRSEVVFHFRKP